MQQRNAVIFLLLLQDIKQRSLAVAHFMMTFAHNTNFGSSVQCQMLLVIVQGVECMFFYNYHLCLCLAAQIANPKSTRPDTPMPST